jgi:hypothetical protein
MAEVAEAGTDDSDHSQVMDRNVDDVAVGTNAPTGVAEPAAMSRKTGGAALHNGHG